MVDAGTVVTLKVSKGPATKKVKVPDNLVGDLIYNVTGQLEDAGFVWGISPTTMPAPKRRTR